MSPVLRHPGPLDSIFESILSLYPREVSMQTRMSEKVDGVFLSLIPGPQTLEAALKLSQ